jgi:hypothetical protein
MVFLCQNPKSAIQSYRITLSARASTVGGIFQFWICDFGFSIVVIAKLDRL